MAALFTIHQIFFSLFTLGCCTPFSTAFVQRNSIIPVIIGISLIILVALVLLSYFFIQLCFKNTKAIDNVPGECEQIGPEQIKLVDYSAKKLSALKNNSFVLPVEKQEEKVSETPNDNIFSMAPRYLRSSIDIQRPKKKLRRASVPAILEVLHETSSSMENSRKMSLSYNCLMEESQISRRTSTTNPDSEIKLATITKIVSDDDPRHVPEDPPKADDQPNTYSIYNDQLSLKESSKLGRVWFSVLYNVDGKWLEVTINRAKYLRGEGRKKKSRFYIKLKLCKPDLTLSASTNSLSGLPQEKPSNKYGNNVKGEFRTCIKSDFCSPEFEETFRFTHVTPAHLKENVLHFLVKEETAKFLEKNKVIGQVIFSLNDAHLTERHESIWEIVREVLPVNPVHDRGLADLSLRYNALSGVLRATIVKVIPGTDPLVDVSAQFYLRSLDDVVNTKRVELNSELEMNESVVFSVDNCFIHTFGLVVVIFSRIRNCPRSPYGRFIVGPIQFCDGPGLFHWEEMCLGEKDVVKSHKII